MFARRETSASGLLATVFLLLATLQTVSAHFSIVYPAWRGNTLHDNQQWDYPCGGMASRGNRTLWPIKGGKISVIPGWNSGHATSLWYVNMGFGTNPDNMTNPMVHVFQLTGPSKDPFPGTFCLQDVPLPANTTVVPGQNATIQLIQVALHGASLYNCADITFVADETEADPVPEGMCANSSTVGFNLVYTTSNSLPSAAPLGVSTLALLGLATGLVTLFA
jgi:hypothetical protein